MEIIHSYPSPSNGWSQEWVMMMMTALFKSLNKSVTLFAAIRNIKCQLEQDYYYIRQHNNKCTITARSHALTVIDAMFVQSRLRTYCVVSGHL